MSRSWERMVAKNRKQVNTARKKQGIQSIGSAAPKKEDVDKFTGRNIAFPVTLVLLGVVYSVITAIGTQQIDWSMMLIVGLYALLGVIFFIRRPYLSVGKSTLGTRRWNGDVRMDASQVKAISTQKGYVFIETKKGANWGFSRFLNRYDTAAMATRLQEYAHVNNIPFEQK